MAHELAGLASGVGKSHTVYHIVQTTLKHRKEIGAGDAFLHIRAGIVSEKLLFKNAVNTTHLLLFTQLHGIVGKLLAQLPGLSGSGGAAVIGAFVAETTIALQKQLGPFTTTKAALGIIILGHVFFSLNLDAAPLRRTAPVMGDGSHVANKGDLESDIINGTHGGFTA